jgi:hypothetical protein
MKFFHLRSIMHPLTKIHNAFGWKLAESDWAFLWPMRKANFEDLSLAMRVGLVSHGISLFNEIEGNA